MLQPLTNELIVGGIVGFLIFWTVVGQIAKGWRDAQKGRATADPMLTAVSLSWDRDQSERGLQALELIAKCLLDIAGSQKSLADQKTTSLDEKLDDLLEKIDHSERQQVERHRQQQGGRPKPRGKPVQR